MRGSLWSVSRGVSLLRFGAKSASLSGGLLYSVPGGSIWPFRPLIDHYHEKYIDSEVTLFKPHGSLNFFKGFGLIKFSDSDRKEKDSATKKTDQISVMPIESSFERHTLALGEDGISNVIPEYLETIDLFKNTVRKESM